ncbi:MAG: sigma-70 family RNA polymerase sigma factor [Gemmatimonadota bacterium]
MGRNFLSLRSGATYRFTSGPGPPDPGHHTSPARYPTLSSESSEDWDTEAPPGPATRLLVEASQGDRSAMDQLLPLVYQEMKLLARSHLSRESQGHTLNATALVHEAYIRLVDQDRVEWQGRAHFFALASLAMRRILISHARARLSGKRGGGKAHVALDQIQEDALGQDFLSDPQAEELLSLDEALEELKRFNPGGARVVEYRFFGGLPHREIAEVEGVSEVTVRRRWTAARAWLRSRLDDSAVQSATSILSLAGQG